MVVRTVVALTIVAALLTGCGGGDSPEPTTTARATSSTAKTRTPAASPKAVTPTPRPAAIPPKPATFDKYAETIAAYLSAAGDAALGESCLKDLFDAWQLPAPGGGTEACLKADIDGDPNKEVAVLLGDSSQATADPMASIIWQVVVLDMQDGAYEVAFASTPMMADAITPAKPALLALDDINKDGSGELVYTETQCGAHTCTVTVHILRAGPSGYVSVSGEGFSMATADVSLEDRDGDGVLELVMSGGTIGSVGAGPQRERTEVYAWDGTAYGLTETTLAPTNILYLRATEADALFSAGLYDQALAVYQEALSDPTLQTWKQPEEMVAPERIELNAYILFRMGLSSIGASGPNDQALGYVQQAVAEYGGNLHGDLANAFLTSYLAKNDVSLACAAAEGFIASHLSLFEAFWDCGYANPIFNAEAVCPF
jgi:tetratricopeptide (TPR) repeat protein